MKPTRKQIQRQVRVALEEDIGNGDVTSKLLDPKQVSHAFVITREPGILCGTDWFDECFYQINNDIRIHWYHHDGDCIEMHQRLCDISGPTAALLTAERTALNFLQTLSATATLTNLYVQQLSGTKVRILDTRKTIPGLRLAQKYAVSCGGGMNHRLGLYDMILIKENHIKSCGSVTLALQKAFEIQPAENVEIEVETLDELREALAAGAKRILLDNFTLDALRDAVEINQRYALLEVSGNVTLQTLKQLADTGIDFISSGALTKNLQALDLSMQLQD